MRSPRRQGSSRSSQAVTGTCHNHHNTTALSTTPINPHPLSYPTVPHLHRHLQPWKTPPRSSRRYLYPPPTNHPTTNSQQAETLEKSARGGFSFFGGRKEKLEDASGEYVRAANGYKARQNYDQAARILERAAQLQNEIGEPDDMANSLVQASQCYTAKPDMLPEDAENAARLLKGAITHYTSKGNFRRAASYEEKMAEVLEKAGDLKGAVEGYEQAGTWYKVEGSTQMANKMFLKVADNAALAGDYRRAIDKYEEVAKSSASNNLMKWSLKEYFFKAAICHLCTGVS